MIASAGNRRAAAPSLLPSATSSPCASSALLSGCVATDAGLASQNGAVSGPVLTNGSTTTTGAAQILTSNLNGPTHTSNGPISINGSVSPNDSGAGSLVPSSLTDESWPPCSKQLPNGVANADSDAIISGTGTRKKNVSSAPLKCCSIDSNGYRCIKVNSSAINCSPIDKVEIVGSPPLRDRRENGPIEYCFAQRNTDSSELCQPADNGLQNSVSRNCSVFEQLSPGETESLFAEKAWSSQVPLFTSAGDGKSRDYKVKSGDRDAKSHENKVKSPPFVTLDMPPNTTNARGAGPGPSTEDEVNASGSNGPLVENGLSSQILHSPHHLPQVTVGGVESVAEFYRGRVLLITGATGFMGKVLVEKLLRSCPAVAKIFLLMRQRGNKDVHTRLQDLLKSQVFDSVRGSCPEALQKVVAVEGDILEPGLGLSEADTQMLVQSVSVVFHAAATVKFDEVIKLSLKMNVLGVKRMIELCKKMNHLVSLVHVSTAYCNCDRNEVEERVYDPPSDPDSLLSLIDLMDDDLFNHLTPKLVGKRPNTYTFTKALAEHVLVTEARDLPIAIVRPSIVSAAWREPIPGWVDNLNGPTGLIVGAGKGMLRTLHCHRHLIADLIPVDIPINLLIVTACYTAMHRNKGEIKVYNCVSGMERPVRWCDIRDHGMHALKNSAAMTDAVWYPSLSLSSYKHINAIGVLIQHWAPAYVLDALARIAGKRPIMVRVAQKLDRAASCLEYFTTHEWRFLSSNVQQLWSQLPPADRKTFNFSLNEMNWPQYMHTYCLGAKRYVMKEEDTTIARSQRHINRLWWVHRLGRVVMLLLAWRLLLLRSPTARRAFYALLRAFLRLISLLPLIRSL